MKLKPTPTSPRLRTNERNEEIEALYKNAPHLLERPSRPRSSLSPFALVVCLLLGIGGGVLGELLTSQYLMMTDVFSVGSAPTVPRSTARTRDDAFDRTALQKTNRASLALYPLRPATGTADDALSEADRLGSALLLTDDGWAVTDAGALEGAEAVVAVTYDKKAFRVTDVTKDPASGLSYFRIALTRASTAEFAATETLTMLANGVALHGEASETSFQGAPVHIASMRGASAERLQSSETITPSLVLDAALPTSYLGGVLVDEKGRVSGIIAGTESDATRVWPSEIVTGALGELVKDGSITRSKLGVTFVDLALTSGIADAVRQNRKAGALLAGDATRAAVALGSPAAKAGLKSGDIILSIDKQTLTEFTRLPEALTALKPGATVPVTFLRAGEERTVTVTLGTNNGE